MKETASRRACCAHHEEPHPRGWRRWLVLVLPLGLVACATCGVHVCADELAAALEGFRLLSAALGRWRS